HVDGNDVEAVCEAAFEAVSRARRGDGPTLLECETYRWSGHYEGDPEKYRTREEVDGWRARDPIAAFRERLAPVVGRQELEQIDAEVEDEIESAADRADAGAETPAGVLLDDVYTGSPGR